MSKRVGGKRKSVKQRLHLTSPYIEDFKSWLRDSGYKTTTIEELEHDPKSLNQKDIPTHCVWWFKMLAGVGGQHRMARPYSHEDASGPA